MSIISSCDFETSCLYCLSPSICSINEESELIEILSKNHSSEINSISPFYFQQAFSSAQFCKNCYAKLIEIKLIIQEIKNLETKISKLSTVLSTKLLDSHINYNDAKDEAQNISNIRRLLFQAQQNANGGENNSEIEFDADNFHEDGWDYIIPEPGVKIVDEDRFSLVLVKDTVENLTTNPFSNDPFDKILKISLERLDLESIDLNKFQQNEQISDEEELQIKKRRGRKRKIDSLSVSTKILLFQCKICCQEFKSKYFLELHLKTHDDTNLTCSKCLKTFSSKSSLNMHESRRQCEKNKESKSLTCHLCPNSTEFPYKSNLSNHLWIAHGVEKETKTDKKLPTCEICSHRALSQRLLHYHMVKKHEIGEFKFKCDICTKQFFKESGLIKHKNAVHLRIIKFTCTYCGKHTSSNHNLEKHILRFHIEKNELKFNCSFCSKSFVSEESLEVHEKIHRNDYPFQCPECPKKFPSKKYFNRHFNIHKGKYKCSVCSKLFSRPSRLRDHENVHKKVKAPNNWSCELCGASFRVKPGLVSHQWNIHSLVSEGDKNFPSCDSCSYRCMTQRQLKDHMAKKHASGDFEFFCETCGKGFVIENELKKHVNIIHLKIKKHACPSCGVGFGTKSMMKKHFTRHHSENRERKFKCSFCFKGFFEKAICEQHEAIHSEERPFPCSYCDKRFPTKGYLSLHTFSSHKKQTNNKEDATTETQKSVGVQETNEPNVPNFETSSENFNIELKFI